MKNNLVKYKKYLVDYQTYSTIIFARETTLNTKSILVDYQRYPKAESILVITGGQNNFLVGRE